MEHLFHLTFGMTTDASIIECLSSCNVKFIYTCIVIFGFSTSFINKYLWQFDEMFHSLPKLYATKTCEQSIYSTNSSIQWHRFVFPSTCALYSPCIMCVQYIGGCLVHWGVFSTLGDTMSTLRGYHEYIWGVQYIGGYHEYIGDVQYIGGIP